MGLFSFVWFIPARLRSRWVDSGSFVRAQGVVGFIRVHSGSIGRALGVVGFIRVRLVYPIALLGSMGSLTFVWFFAGLSRELFGLFGCFMRFACFVHIHSGACRKSFGSFCCALGLFGFYRFSLLHSGTP